MPGNAASLCALLSLLPGQPADVAEPVPAAPTPGLWEGWLTNLHLEVGLSTQVPISAGAQARVEGPLGLFVEGEVGFLPRPYFAAVNAAVVALGGYDRATADVLENALENSLVLRGTGGIRPIPTWGLELFGGYTYMRGSGNLNAVAALLAVPGVDVPALEGVTLDVPVLAELHNFHVGIGWRWVLFDWLAVRASLAYLQSFAASAGLDLDAIDAQRPMRPVVEEGLSLLSGAVNRVLAPRLIGNVKTPVAGLSLSLYF